jgi:hypothetical protein
MKEITGQLNIVLTADEARALEKGLRELTYSTGAAELKAWRSIQDKLKAALERL